jgi:polyhydroxybutyrate depolymerase
MGGISGLASSIGGSAATGGIAASGGASVASGSPGTGGSSATGGTPSIGGRTSAGGTAGVAIVTGGTTNLASTMQESGAKSTGGTTSAGGTKLTGGTTSAGGTTLTGGTLSVGGTSHASGTTNLGGTVHQSGGTSTGGTSDAGGTTHPGGATNTAGNASQTCPASKAPPTAGNHVETLQHGGRARSYIVHAPSGLNASKLLVVVFDLHGAGGSGSQQQGLSGWQAVADGAGFLIIYPDGVDGYWNVDDTCCGTAGSNKIDDVGFIKAIIEKLSSSTCVDSKRIYVTGFSNGGGLAHRMGCQAADVIAAIAPVATDLRTQPCNPVRPISMIEFRGTGDTTEPYDGGLVGPAGGQYLAVGAKASLKLWADINQCTGTTAAMDTYCESYTACGDGVETDLCSLPNVNHNAYSNSLSFNVAKTAWKVFQRQPLN